MRLTLLPALALLSLTLPACHGQGTLFTHGCVAVTDRATCATAAAADAPILNKGTVDAAYAAQYTGTVLVEGQGLSSSVTLDEALVTILDPLAGGSLAAFSAPSTAPLEPSAPLATLAVTLLDAGTLKALASKVTLDGKVQEVVARIIVRGHDTDNTQLTTLPVDFPIDIDVSVGSSCVATNGQPCSGGSAGSVADCRLGMDEPAGTSCQSIAAMLGACHELECDVDATTMKSDLSTARCPVHVPADDSCCHP